MEENGFRGRIFGLVLLLISGNAAALDSGIGVFVDHIAYQMDSAPKLYVSGFNNEAGDVAVDVHVVVIGPDNVVYEYPDWNTSFQPWFSAISLPSGFQLPAIPIGDMSGFPGGIVPGIYRAVAALTMPGTLDIVSLHTVPFKVLKVMNSVTTAGPAFSHNRFYANGTTVELLGTAAEFWTSTQNLPELQQKLDMLFAPLEQCVFDQLPFIYADIVADHGTTALDVGNSLSLTSSAGGTVALDKISGTDGLSYSAIPEPANAFYQPGAVYTVTGAGNSQFAPFSVSVRAPDTMVLTMPDLAVVTTVDAGEDLQLEWQGNNGIGDVRVLISGGSLAQPARISCRFSDDGSATIPASLLTQLRDVLQMNASGSSQIAGVTIPLDSSSIVSLAITRGNYEFLNTSDADSTNFNVSVVAGGSFSLE